MVAFYPLTVTNIERTTVDSVVLTLQPPAHEEETFRFIQGQYLTFRRRFEGEELRRSYSICAGITDPELRVGVRRVEGGWFSSWANDQLAVGDVLESMPPMGRFYVPLDPERGREYVGIAGGSGITPVLGILRTVLHAEPLSRFTLIYGNRSSSTTMFRVELENLKNEFMQRLNIVHVLEHNSDELPIFKGRLDEAKCASLFEHWVSVTSLDAVFVCGPQPMMDAAIAALQSSGVDRSLIKFEKFASVPPKVRKQVEQSQATNGHAESCNATLRIDGVDHHLEVPMGGTTTLLDAALAAHIDAPYACAAGVCSTCVARLVDGEVAMGANYALDDDEVEDGLILTCQSRPVTRHLVVEYDV